ncbi:tetratricopeptide repeat protein [Desulfovibrio sp. OttesenSCG-928-C06]|nr:tetratricopeptide repeat protein [Desulfovibrio sp. OttesenSCG-928-C06]
MRGEPVFLGVYVKVADSDASSDAPRWHAWGLPDGNFLLQEAPREQSGRSAGINPGAGVKRLSVEEFFTDFRVYAAFSDKHKPLFPGNASSPAEAAKTPEAAGRTGTAPAAGSVKSAGAANLSGSAKSPGLSGPSVSAGPAGPSGAASPDNSARPASPASSGDPAKPAPAPQQGTARTAMPDSDATDLVSYLTAGMEQDSGHSYTVVRGTPEDDGVHSVQQAQELVYIDELDDVDNSAAEMDEEEIARVEQGFRTEFSLALIRLKSKRGDALQSLEQLARSDGPFAREHKFMFSDCGTALRKRNLYVLAQQFHERARELAPDDEHVLFNLARVLYECGKTDKAKEYLAMSVDMAPDFQAGKDFLAFLNGRNRS